MKIQHCLRHRSPWSGLNRKVIKKVEKFFVLFLLLAMVIKPAILRAQVLNREQISFEQFEEKLKQASPNPQILDARSAEEFELNHLKGAVQVTVSDDAALQQRIEKLDKKKPVFVYSINNGRSGQLAKKLRDRQFEVYELPGGISKWIGAGRPVDTKTGNGLTLQEYNKLIQSDNLVLVDVHSKFCGSCKKLSPIVDSVASANSNGLKVVKVELFDNKQLAKELNIESLPTLLLYKGDKIVWQNSGLTTRKTIESAIKSQR